MYQSRQKKISESLNSYMNSLLKCLYYIKELREYLISNKDIFNLKQPVSRTISNIMYKLQKDASKYFTSEELQEIIGDKNNIIVGGKAGDSNSIFSSIIDSFLNELSYFNFLKYNTILTPNSNDSSNKKNVFNFASNDIDKNNIINILFLGYYETIYQCKKNFSINTYSIENEYCINFNIEKIGRFYNYKEEITLYECFEYYFGSNNKKTDFYCSKCDEKENNYYWEKIYKPPTILVIVLNRGNNNNYDGIVRPEAFIDLTNYVDQDGYRGECLYNLICLPTKYSACCLTDSGFYFNSPTIEQEINQSQLNRDEPFLLFYRKIQ